MRWLWHETCEWLWAGALTLVLGQLLGWWDLPSWLLWWLSGAGLGVLVSPCDKCRRREAADADKPVKVWRADEPAGTD